MGDSFDRFAPRQRGRFGDDEFRRRNGGFVNDDYPRRNQVERVRMFECDMILRQDRPTSIMVSEEEGARAKWIALPKSQIQYEMSSTTMVHITMPEWLAKEKGLI